MKAKLNPTILALVLLVCAALGCKFGKTANSNQGNSNTNASTVTSNKLNDIHMARDDNGEPGQKAENFGPGDRTIHCVARLKDPTPGTRIRFSWWAVSAKGATNEKIRDIDYTTKENENIVHSNLLLKNDWPPGKYKVEVFVNDALDKTVNFTVE